MKRYKRLTIAALAALTLALAAPSAQAGIVVFDGSAPGVGNNYLAARAEFECTANLLIITLTNISTAYTEIPAELLSGVSFDIAGSPVLTPVSVFIAPGSVTVNNAPTGPSPGEVSGEWAYRGDLNGPFNGAQYGINVNGQGDLFGPPHLFPGIDLDPPASPNGMNYGIVSAGGIGPNANLPLTVEPFVQNSVVITLSHNGGFTCEDIFNVGFQYGTSQSEPFYPGDPIPEPATASLLLMGLAGLAARLRRKKS